MNGEYEQGTGASGKAPYAIVDACVFGQIEGNPAAVVQLAEEMPTASLLRLAREMDEPVTAFVTDRAAAGAYNIRWFTRNCELRICGHATLAASEWMLTLLGPGRSVEWHSRAGVLTADRDGDRVTVTFPETVLHRMKPEAADKLAATLGRRPKECLVADADYLAVLDTPEEVMKFEPEAAAIEDLDCRGVIITARYSTPDAAKQEEYDIVSRYFAPRIAIPEDEVCVSAHCALYPYWTKRLGLRRLRAFQASPRGGVLELVSHHRGRVSATASCRVNSSGLWNVVGTVVATQLAAVDPGLSGTLI
ncbi:PhzF family phenazine biosynthesis protein [Catenulispora sp. NL8]|uniref:PhzF family phenazine biosynthesis protein n=1 Tax=Catenulispora pinistramenti TaxID=2705254 RepID=A0ABS5KXV1_9ACTN|nr:PhzF family phenazine biosynthesis protein [Catenulispora pinistramenti]MBS2550869.1 PhzF family phenazine biosynthesis protein [Catenulispora pinistramenti]